MSFEAIVPRRRKTGGRVKGTPNKRTALARDLIQEVFDTMGGAGAFAKWAESDQETKRIFYAQIWSKLLPLQGAAPADPGQADPVSEKRDVRFFRPTIDGPSGDPAEGGDI